MLENLNCLTEKSDKILKLIYMLLQERLKRRRQEIYEENQRAEEQRNKLDAEIDAWQAEIRKKENEKREVNVSCLI